MLCPVLLIAGCLGAEQSPLDETQLPFTPDSELPDFRPIEDNGAEPRTLQAPPQWKQGEWWRVKVVDLLGKTFETTRVVAGQEGDDYLVGMPMDEFINDLMVLHLPGFGQVSKEDLSFEIHDVRYEPLRFPLVEGDTWATAFEGRPVTAKVFLLGEMQARVQLDGSQDHINVTYDAETGEIVKHVQPGYATVEVLEHGFDYSGYVIVPHMHDLIFAHGRIGGVLGPNLQPAPSLTDAVRVDSTYDRVSFAIILGRLNPTVTLGYYAEKATAPNGKTFELAFLPTEAGQFKIAVYDVVQPGGDWRFEHTAAGPGFAFAEGIAYHTYVVELPSGRVLPSTGEHRHGGP